MTVYYVTDENGTREANEEEVLFIEETKKNSDKILLENEIKNIKDTRNYLLLSSDWIELPSALERLSSLEINNWKIYRQELRDITAQDGFPFDVTYPNKPVA
jgi:hypothetical protein